MKRIVGLPPRKNTSVKKQAPPKPGLDDIVQSTDRKIDDIEAKIVQCDNELRKVNQQMKNVPPGSSKQSLMTKARGILSRKKRFEQQAEQLREKSFNMDSLSSSIGAAEEVKIITGVMKSGTKNLKKHLKKVDLDEIENFQEELTDLIELTDDIQAAMAKSYDVPQDIDDDELNTQLELLGDEIVQDNDPSYIDAVLKPPSSGSAGPSCSARVDNKKTGPPGAVAEVVYYYHIPPGRIRITNFKLWVARSGKGKSKRFRRRPVVKVPNEYKPKFAMKISLENK